MNTDPFQIIQPSERWKPQSQEQQNSVAPLVQKIREAVAKWRNTGDKNIDLLLEIWDKIEEVKEEILG